MTGQHRVYQADKAARKVGQALARDMSHLTTVEVIRAAIIAVRELGELDASTAERALAVADQFALYPLAVAGDMAPIAIRCARDMAVFAPELASRALVVLGDLAFAPDDAISAVNWLEQSGYAVTAVELWPPERDPTKLIYSRVWNVVDEPAPSPSANWSRYVAYCAEHVRAGIEVWRGDKGLDFFERCYPHVTFTFAWGDEAKECLWERLNVRG